MNQKMPTKKQFISRRTKIIAIELYMGLLSPKEREGLTWKTIQENFPKVTKSKDYTTGVVTTGLSLKGIKNLVKKKNFITTEEVAKHFGIKVDLGGQ